MSLHPQRRRANLKGPSRGSGAPPTPQRRANEKILRGEGAGAVAGRQRGSQPPQEEALQACCRVCCCSGPLAAATNSFRTNTRAVCCSSNTRVGSSSSKAEQQQQRTGCGLPGTRAAEADMQQGQQDGGGPAIKEPTCCFLCFLNKSKRSKESRNGRELLQPLCSQLLPRTPTVMQTLGQR